MNKILAKTLVASPKFSLYARMAFVVLTLLGFASSVVTAQVNISPGTVTQPLCQVFNVVHTAIFILGIVLMILGGTLYAGGNVAPGQAKGAVQGYGMGMIIGGVVGVIIAVLSPFILQLISNNSNITSSC